MAREVKVKISSDPEDARKGIENAISELRALAYAAKEGSDIAKRAFKSEAEELAQLVRELGGTTRDFDRLAAVVRQFERQTETMARRGGLATERVARGFAQLTAESRLSVRSIDSVIGGLSDLAFSFGPQGALVGAVAISGLAIIRMLHNVQSEVEKTHRQLREMEFFHDFERAKAQMDKIVFDLSEAQRKLSLAQQAAEQTRATIRANADPSDRAMQSLLASEEARVRSAQREVDQLTKQRDELLPVLNKLAQERAQWDADGMRIEAERKKQLKEETAALREHRALARDMVAIDKYVAQYGFSATEARLEQSFAKSFQKASAQFYSGEAIAKAFENLPANKLPTFTAIDAKQLVGDNVIPKVKSLDDALFHLGITARKTLSDMPTLAAVAMNGLVSASLAGFNAMITGQGNVIRAAKRAFAEPIVAHLEMKAAENFALALSDWRNPAAVAKDLQAAGIALAEAAVVARLGGLSGGGGSVSTGAGGGSAGTSTAQLAASGTAGSQPQQTVYIVVSGDLKMDGAAVGRVRAKIQRAIDRAQPVRAVL